MPPTTYVGPKFTPELSTQGSPTYLLDYLEGVVYCGENDLLDDICLSSQERYVKSLVPESF
mgnify:CR=1 FL=1